MSAASFESNIKKLEEIVARLEAGDIGLDESLKLFEQGINLSDACLKQLDDSENKMKVLLNEDEQDNDDE